MKRLFARMGAIVVATACAVASAGAPAHAGPGNPADDYTSKWSADKYTSKWSADKYTSKYSADKYTSKWSGDKYTSKWPKKYAALGDSYSAGVGAGMPTDLDCFRSPNGYPALIADAVGWDLNYLACSGALIPAVIEQAGEIKEDTDFVTLTAGGNDIGFIDILGFCAIQNDDECAARIALADDVRQSQLPGALNGLYGTVKAAAPEATIVVVGYPRLFGPRTDCLVRPTPQGPFVTITENEAALLNAFADRLNDTIEERAEANGLAFANAIPAFDGHAVCSDDAWINGFLGEQRADEQFHPNADGQSGYARLVVGELVVTGTATIS